MLGLTIGFTSAVSMQFGDLLHNFLLSSVLCNFSSSSDGQGEMRMHASLGGACFSLQKMTFLGLELWTTNRDMIVLGENSCGKRPSSNYKRRPHDSPCLGKSLWRPEAANHTPRPNGDRLPFGYSMRFGWFLTRFRFTWFDAGVNFSSCGSSLVRAGANHGLHADDHMLLQGSYHGSWGYQIYLLCEPRQDLYLDLTDATSKSTSPTIFLTFFDVFPDIRLSD